MAAMMGLLPERKKGKERNGFSFCRRRARVNCEARVKPISWRQKRGSAAAAQCQTIER